MPEQAPLVENDEERKRRAVDIVLKDFAANFQEYDRRHWSLEGPWYARHFNGTTVMVCPAYHRSLDLKFSINLGPISVDVSGPQAEQIKSIIQEGERAKRVRDESQVLAKFAAGAA